MIASGLATAGEAIFDLDFHAVMHWGDDPVLEKHYVPRRSQRTRSVLTFFAEDAATHTLLYANAAARRFHVTADNAADSYARSMKKAAEQIPAKKPAKKKKTEARGA